MPAAVITGATATLGAAAASDGACNSAASKIPMAASQVPGGVLRSGMYVLLASGADPPAVATMPTHSSERGKVRRLATPRNPAEDG